MNEKIAILIFVVALVAGFVFFQQKKQVISQNEESAFSSISEAQQQAKRSGKVLLVKIGEKW